MSDPAVTPANALAELERFVVDSEDLLQLEEHIGRFNIFDALRIDRAEIRHSNFLAWLLDPAESHGQGALFLKAVLKDLLKQAPPELRPLSHVELGGAELQGVRIQREESCIDLLITCKSPRFAIAIENKIDSEEHGDQLQRYEQTLNELHGNIPRMMVFLTKTGQRASHKGWHPWSYKSLHGALWAVHREHESKMRKSVHIFIEQYLETVRSWFMNDPEVQKRCREIYAKHRRAIDLIIECVGDEKDGIRTAIEQTLRSDPHWQIVFVSPKRDARPRVNFSPVSWAELLPNIGTDSQLKPTDWFYTQFAFESDELVIQVVLAPTRDPVLRRSVFTWLKKSASQFDLEFEYGERSDKWTVFRKSDALPATQSRNCETCLSWVAQQLPIVRTEMEIMRAALQPVFDEWKQTRPS